MTHSRKPPQNVNEERNRKNNNVYAVGSNAGMASPNNSLNNGIPKCALPRAVYVDKLSRIVFPIFFGLFNLVYWLTYSRSHR